MIDHISINVSNPEVSIAFYVAALKPLGYRIVTEHGSAVSMGAPLPNAPENTSIPPDLRIVSAESPALRHIAVSAPSAKQVDVFYRAAIAVSGADNGESGKRPYYHPGYYVAFALNLGDNNLEAVSRGN